MWCRTSSRCPISLWMKSCSMRKIYRGHSIKLTYWTIIRRKSIKVWDFHVIVLVTYLGRRCFWLKLMVSKYCTQVITVERRIVIWGQLSYLTVRSMSWLWKVHMEYKFMNREIRGKRSLPKSFMKLLKEAANVCSLCLHLDVLRNFCWFLMNIGRGTQTSKTSQFSILVAWPKNLCKCSKLIETWWVTNWEWNWKVETTLLGQVQWKNFRATHKIP